MTDPPATPHVVPVCPRHPDRESYVRCQRCARPTCPDCQRPAPVGIQCVDCVTAAAKEARTTRTVFGGAVSDGRPVVTFTLIGLTVLMYVAQLASAEVTQRFVFAPIIGYSEPWRFLTNMFLHDTGTLRFSHLGFNMFALWMLGPYVEALLGRLRFALVYLVSGLGGSVGVLLLVRAPTGVVSRDLAPGVFQGWWTGVLGASGAVFGLFGAMLVLNRRLGRSSSWVYATLAINAVFGFIYAGISWQAHLGGFVTGLGCAAVMAGLRQGSVRRWQVPALLGVVVILAALAWLKYLGVPADFR